MPGIITGHRAGGLPIIKCALRAPGSRSRTVLSALVDTGATHCVANPDKIAAAGLPFDRTIAHTVIGHPARDVPAYKAEIILTGRMVADPDRKFVFTTNDALVLSEPLSGFDMIIGWDLLHGVNATFDRNGAFSLLFG